jgi:hypothetical protein
MIECTCIDADNKPKEIPFNKWLKEGRKYNVIFTCTVLPQKLLAFQLAEIELTDAELPYEYFSSYRFAFTEENLLKLIELIKDCENIDFDMNELLKQTELEPIKI